MKTSFLFTAVSAFLLALTQMSAAQEQKNIDLDAYDELMVGGDFKVIISEELSGSLRLEGPKDAIDEVSVTLRNQKLRIEKKKSSYWMNFGKGSERVTVTVPSTAFKGIYLSGSGNLSGAIQAAHDLKVVVSGSGSIESDIQNAHSVHASVSGSGDLELTGSCDTLTLQIAGSGNIHAEALTAKVVEAKIAGSGNGRIHVSERLSASIAGSGNLTYSGNPNKVDKSVAGSGRIRSKN
ncbi:MAG: hypothetical protein RLZZ242_685 [Bacteroidota bacterium]|jgi:cytoskeletal protein CcmA (bactofilin family)